MRAGRGRPRLRHRPSRARPHGLRVQATIGAREIVICYEHREVARHPRLHGRYQTAARLDHYLELLRLKPGALKGSLPLRQERERGRWPSASTSSGKRSSTATADRRRRGRWSTCCSCVATTAAPASSSPSAAHSPPALATAARSPCSPAAASGQRSNRCSRLAKAVVDRLTHRAHIIETGSESWRFKHGLAHNARRRRAQPA